MEQFLFAGLKPLSYVLPASGVVLQMSAFGFNFGRIAVEKTRASKMWQTYSFGCMAVYFSLYAIADPITINETGAVNFSLIAARSARSWRIDHNDGVRSPEQKWVSFGTAALCALATAGIEYHVDRSFSYKPFAQVLGAAFGGLADWYYEQTPRRICFVGMNSASFTYACAAGTWIFAAANVLGIAAAIGFDKNLREGIRRIPAIIARPLRR